MHSIRAQRVKNRDFARVVLPMAEPVPLRSLTYWHQDQPRALPENPYGSLGGCYCSLTHTGFKGTEDKDMKITVSTILVFMISTAQAFAGTPQQVGAWSVIPATGDHSDNAVLIQTASKTADAKLDLICRKGKIWKVVVETSVPLQERAVSFNRGIPTTRIGFVSDSANNQFEDWAVADGGKTLSVHAQMFESRLHRQWIERLSSSRTMRFSFDTRYSTFQTGKLTQALESAGCSY